MRLAIPTLLLATACAEGAVAPEIAGDRQLHLDKQLVQPDELAAAVAARTAVDMATEPHLFTWGASQPATGARSPLAACALEHGTSEVAWVTTECSGLHGWAVVRTFDDCLLPDGQELSGSLVWSTPDILVQLGPDVPAEEASDRVGELLRVFGAQSPYSYTVSVDGLDGGHVEACGTTRITDGHRRVQETAEFDIDGLEGRVVWTADVGRVQAGTEGARDVAQGMMLTQFPIDPLVQPDRLSVAGWARHVAHPLPDGGQFVQLGQHGRVYGLVDPETATSGHMEVQAPEGVSSIALPSL